MNLQFENVTDVEKQEKLCIDLQRKIIAPRQKKRSLRHHSSTLQTNIIFKCSICHSFPKTQ